MQREDAKAIIKYYQDINKMKQALKRECREIEDEYCGLRGISIDGMPHGATKSSPVENAAILIIESGAAERIRDIETRVQVLENDRKRIQSALDTISSKYKNVLSMRYISKYSWAKISVKIGVPDSTVRHWEAKALDRFGKAMEDTGKTDEILARATRARE